MGFAVFKHSARSHDGTATRGDPGAAVTAAAAVAGVLAVLMGVGSGDLQALNDVRLPARVREDADFIGGGKS